MTNTDIPASEATAVYNWVCAECGAPSEKLADLIWHLDTTH